MNSDRYERGAPRHDAHGPSSWHNFDVVLSPKGVPQEDGHQRVDQENEQCGEGV